MAGDNIEAERPRHSEEAPEYRRHCSDEEQVDKSYQENSAGKQAAVDNVMSNVDFLQREGDLTYVIPKGVCSCMHMQ